MHHKINENIVVYALFGLAFAIGIFGTDFLPDFGKASVLEYGDSNSTLEDDVISFHLQINETTNDFLEQLTEEEAPNVNYPTSDEECGEDNVSTFCLASILNEELTAFEIGMRVHKKRFREVEDSKSLSLDEAVRQQEIRGSLVDSEVAAAKNAIDLTLAVYNEAQLAYPIHRELVRLVDNLEDYRDNLAKVRDSIELYPSEFNDVSTIQCK